MSNPIELIPQGVTALVALFEERAELRFPDLDAAVLQDGVAEVERVAAEVQRIEAELERARELLAVRQDGLLVKAQRALAYARVFAEEDPLLSDRLAQVSLPRARRAAATRTDAAIAETVAEAPAPRKRKQAKQSEPLFGEAAPMAEAS